MLFVALLSFFPVQLCWVTPSAIWLGQETSHAEMDELRERLGLNDPFILKFGRFLGDAVQGKFGISYRLQKPVDELIAERMPATLELVFLSAVIATTLGVLGGLVTGLKPDSWFSKLILTGSLLGFPFPPL